MTRPTTLLVRLPLLLLGLIVSLAVLANGLSRFLENDFPEVAIVANPLNSEAVVQIGVKTLAKPNASIDADQLQLIERANRLAPADARLFSLLGVVKDVQGDALPAQQNYNHALHLLPTENVALRRTFVQDVREGRIAEAVDKIEVFMRRSGTGGWANVAPYVAALADNDNGLTALQNKYASFPNGRRAILQSLIGDNGNLEAAYRLVLNWHGDGVSPIDTEVNVVGNALIRQGRPNAAYELFKTTRSDVEKAESGYVHNGSFNLPATDNVYDWKIKDQSGVSITTVQLDRQQESDSDTHSFVNLRFRGNPLQLKNVFQVLRLPGGAYKLTVKYSTDELKVPKPLRFSLNCLGLRRNLVTLNLPQGTTPVSTMETVFVVPNEGCLFSKVEMNNEFVALSFNNRFEGEVNIYDFRITRMEN